MLEKSKNTPPMLFDVLPSMSMRRISCTLALALFLSPGLAAQDLSPAAWQDDA